MESQGFKGLPPKVGVMRGNNAAQPTLEARVRATLEGRTILRIDYEQTALTLHLDNGAVFTMNNYGGFTEV